MATLTKRPIPPARGARAAAVTAMTTRAHPPVVLSAVAGAVEEARVESIPLCFDTRRAAPANGGKPFPSLLGVLQAATTVRS